MHKRKTFRVNEAEEGQKINPKIRLPNVNESGVSFDILAVASGALLTQSEDAICSINPELCNFPTLPQVSASFS